MKFPDPDTISPQDFELLVKEWFESCKGSLHSFKSEHRTIKNGYDGEYEIDVSISFEVFNGAKIDVIVECKKHKHPIGRDLVQVLKERKSSTAANKAFLVTTSKFQSGAIEYASKHGIALVQIVDGRAIYIQANAAPAAHVRCPDPEKVDKFAALLWVENPKKQLILPMMFASQKSFTFEYYLEDGWK